MSLKNNETCESYLEIDIPEHFFLKILHEWSNGPFVYLYTSYLYASIRQYGGQREWEKPLHQMMLD